LRQAGAADKPDIPGPDDCYSHGSAELPGDTVHHVAHLAADLRVIESEGERRLHEARLVAAVVARPFEAVAVKRTAADHRGHGVGQLDLVAGAALAFRQVL